MTLGQAKQIVRFLLDGELFNQYEEKLNSYFDLGQKRIAATTDFILRKKSISCKEKTKVILTEFDSDFYKLRSVEGGRWERLSPTEIVLFEGDYTLCYCVYPATITAHTKDDVSFEISEAAQSALPYYVAAQVTIAEHDLRYHQVYSDEFADILEHVDELNRLQNIHVTTLEGNR